MHWMMGIIFAVIAAWVIALMHTVS
jgi:hypothetical protein